MTEVSTAASTTKSSSVTAIRSAVAFASEKTLPRCDDVSGDATARILRFRRVRFTPYCGDFCVYGCSFYGTQIIAEDCKNVSDKRNLAVAAQRTAVL